MRLDELQTGQKATIVKILSHGAFRKRLTEMGFIKGQQVNVLLHAPLLDPIKYSIMGYEISLRRSEAHMIEVISSDEEHSTSTNDESEAMQNIKEEKSHSGSTPTESNNPSESAHTTINVALIGNPNCGKTSLFNVASGAKEHVGNYSGVTVDAKTGHLNYKGYRINMVDLPGTYSLTSYSAEELYVREYLSTQTPDVIINVVDASNLERNLYLTTDLISMDRRMVIALNMYDELQRHGDSLDYALLGNMIGVPIVPTVSKNGRGIEHLLDTVVNVFEDANTSVRHIHIPFSPDVEHAISILKDFIKADHSLPLTFSPRYLGIQLLCGDEETIKIIKQSKAADHILDTRRQLVENIERSTGDDINSIVANEKYGFISGALAETLVKNERNPQSSTNLIDAFVTNKLFGFPIFLLVMFFIFWATFQLGAYPMEWIENAISALSSGIDAIMPPGTLKDLIIDGVIGGVGGVIVFLPNILILYFCISFMEDSGYMARAAFIMDKLMHRIGLHGKSFIPLIMGFGCNVPSIIASRTIESRTSRIITILINPFISCSARIPIYVLLVGTFFPNHAPLVFIGIYLLGVIVAIITARLLRKFLFPTDETPFVMELPPYRVPTLKASIRHTWAKGQQYLHKMGGVILVASIIVWALNYFPLNRVEPTSPADSERINVQTDSYLEMAGKAINPIMTPLGFHWRASVAALAGIPAKEIVVSTLGVLYTGAEESPESTLSARLTKPSPVTHRPDFTPASALAFMIFILLYCPCIATITAIVKETRHWGYGAFSIIYNTAVAWIIAAVAYQLLSRI